ncbi:MAG: histidine ammonia-lyase [Ascidiaceihabitans sp.]|jgi:histidine ammonia-lyase
MLHIGSEVSVAAFCDALHYPAPVSVEAGVYHRLETAHRAVLTYAQGSDPVYGLNTGLGANLGHRVSPDQIDDFQLQTLRGRAVATGPALSAEVGRGVILSRLISAAKGHSGLSRGAFDHLLAILNAGIAPVVPKWGSIGAGDLTQNATAMLALWGEGSVWNDGEVQKAATVLHNLGIVPPPLTGRDAMALINHSGVAVTAAALAVHATMKMHRTLRCAALLSYAGYDANRLVLSPAGMALHSAPGQDKVASWLLTHLDGTSHAPRRIQEALSFRTIAQVLGAAEDAASRACELVNTEINASPDSPAVLANGTIQSTANFHTPALSLVLEAVSLADTMAAYGSTMRIQRMMDPDLSGLPKYLSSVGGRSAGLVPLQKTTAALAAEVKRLSQPVAFDPAPVSDGVEDMAPMTVQAATKLSEQVEPIKLIAGIEALTAAQAISLRQPQSLSQSIAKIMEAIRAKIPMLNEDRALAGDAETVTAILEESAANL